MVKQAQRGRDTAVTARPARAPESAVAAAGSAYAVPCVAGNQAALRLLEAGALQAKLRVSRPQDPDEREADRVADRILRMPAAVGAGGGPWAGPPPAVVGAGGVSAGPPPAVMGAGGARGPVASVGATGGGPPPAVTVGGPPCPRCRDTKPDAIHRKAGLGGETPAGVHEFVGGLGPGRPLDAASRAFFEPRLGWDFGRVRLHADSRAAESAQAIGALAYTVGRDIVFGAGQYAPETEDGRRLLAHELTHVVQQAGGADPGDSGAGAPAISRAAPALQRRDEEESEGAGERPLTRPEEIALSRSSPGEVAATARPPRISLYNFAIDSATLKDRHREALAEVASLIRRAGTARTRVMVVGHTDNTGEPAVNGPLSRRRARAVQRTLARLAGTDVLAEWAGESNPVETNDTVEGRSRNRRVDILFLPPPTPTPTPSPLQGGTPPEPTPPTPPPTTEPPGGGGGRETEDDDTWFCAQHPILCGAIGAGIAGLGALLWFCIQNPASCLPTPGGEEEEEEREARACLVSARLPSGRIAARGIGPVLAPGRYMLMGGFSMGLTFRNDDSGCACRCGEYMQVLKGFAERDDATGHWRDDPPMLVGGPLDRTEEREDLRGGVTPYGHRVSLVGNTDKDSFEPDRLTGCEYRGSDDPSMTSSTPGERLRFRFEFRGGAVDGCRGRVPIGTWSSWVVEGSFTVPRPTPPPPPPPTTEPPPPTPTPEPTPREDLAPEPYRGPSIGAEPAPAVPRVFCLGGQIACATLDFIRERGGRFRILTDEERRQAVDMEQRILIREFAALAPRATPVDPDAHFRWIAEMRRQAEQRVSDVLTGTVR